MKQPPLPRAGVYERYWYFASERQQIFLRRLRGEPGPWTEDPVLCAYKFCNVFRAADRVSQYLLREVAYGDPACIPEDRVFRIVAFRTFSKPETWEGIRAFLGRWPVISDLVSGDFARALASLWESGHGLYTGAFILCAANAYGQPRKYLNHVELFRHMFVKDRLHARILSASSLRSVYELLRAYPLMGDFMSYQTAIDLNYSELINFSENDFTKAGPGALRGMKKVFVSFGDYTPDELVHWMVERQDAEFARLGLPAARLFGRPLHAIDCQGLFCETDKYCRVALPELVSARKRMKAHFAPRTDMISYFFPPKWKIRLS